MVTIIERTPHISNVIYFIGDVIAVLKTMDKGKEPMLEQIHILGSLIFFLWGDQPSLEPLKEVYIDYTTCNHHKKAIVNRDQNRKRVNVDMSIMCRIKESILNTKKDKLNDLLSV
jgi:hypothetical protein